jgi:hypothetical protein
MTARRPDAYTLWVEVIMAKQDDPIIKTTVRLPLPLLKAVKYRAIDENKDMNEIVICALQQYLGKKGGHQ